MYSYFMAGTMIPVNPSTFTISIPSKNEVVTLINDGDVNILKKRGLKEFSFEMYLPQVKYPFARYTSGYERDGELSSITPPLDYLILLQSLKEDRLPFQLDIYRELPDGTQTWHTNETVSLESYDVTEDANNGFDVVVSVNLKEYRHYSTQKVILSDDGLTYSTVRETGRKTNRIIQARRNDTIQTICLREFGYTSAELTTKIFKLNYNTFCAYNKNSLPLTVHEGMQLRLV